MEHFSQFGEIKDVFIALSAGGSTRVGYALLYPATPETVESIVNSSPHTIRDTTLKASYPRESMPMAKRWREHEAEEQSHDSHVTQPEGDTLQDVGNTADDYISDTSLTIDYEDAAENCPEQGGDAVQAEGEPNTSSATQGETAVDTASLPFDGKLVQPEDKQSESEPSPVEESEQKKRHSPSHDEGHKKPGESERRAAKEDEAKQGKDEGSPEHRSSERGRTPRSEHRDRRDRLERRQRSRSRERRRWSPSPREERSRFGMRRGGRHSPPSGSSERSARSRRPLSASSVRPRATSRWDSDDRSENRSRQSFPSSQDSKHHRPNQDFNSRGRPRDYPRPGPRSSMGVQPMGPGPMGPGPMGVQPMGPGPMGPQPTGPMGPEPIGPGPMGPGHGSSHHAPFNSPPWGRKTLLPTPPVHPNEDTPIPPPGQGGPAENYPLRDGPPPDESRWNRRESVGHGFVDQHYSGPPDQRGRFFERDSFGAGPPFGERGPPPQAHHPPDSSWQGPGRGPTQGAQQPSFGGSGNQRQPQIPPGWQQNEMSSGGMQHSNFRSDSQSDHRGHQQGFVSDSRSQPGSARPLPSASAPHYDDMQNNYAGLHQTYQGQPPQGYTAPSGKVPTESYDMQQASYVGQQQNSDGQQTSHGGQHQHFGGQQQTFGGQQQSFEKHPPPNYSRQWASNEQGPHYDGRKQHFDQPQGQQQRYDGQQQNFDNPQQRFDGQQQSLYGQQQRYDGQQPRYEGQQPRYEGQQQRYEGQQPRYEDQQPRYEGQQPRYEGQQPRYEGQQPRYEGQQPIYEGQHPRYEGQQPRYEGQQPRYEGQQPRYEGQQPRYEGQQPRYEGQQPRYEVQQPRYEGQQPRYEGQQQRFDGPEPRPDGRQPAYGQSQQSVQPHYTHHQPNFGQPQQEYGHGRDAPPTSRPTHPHQQSEYVSDSRVGQGPPQPSGVGASVQGPPSTSYSEERWRRQEAHPPQSHPSLFHPPRTNQEDQGTRGNQYSHPAPQQGYRSAPSHQGQSSHDVASMHRSTHEVPASAHGNSMTTYGGYQGDNVAKYGHYQGTVGPAGNARGPGVSRFREEERQQGGTTQYGRPQPRKAEWQSHDQRDHTHRSQPSRDWSAAPSSRPQERTQPTPDVGYMPTANPASTQQAVPKIDTKALEALLADSDNIYSAYIKRAKSQD